MPCTHDEDNTLNIDIKKGFRGNVLLRHFIIRAGNLTEHVIENSDGLECPGAEVVKTV